MISTEKRIFIIKNDCGLGKTLIFAFELKKSKITEIKYYD